jgi:ubiquitin-conjugating enzyme E2 M
VNKKPSREKRLFLVCVWSLLSHHTTLFSLDTFLFTTQMIKLRELQQKSQQTNKTSDPNNSGTQSTGGDSSSGTGYVLRKQKSRDLAELRSSKKSNESIFGRKRERGKRSKNNAAELRAQKDISEMDMDAMPGIKVEFPDPNNIMSFKAIIKPNSGLYQGAEFVFKIEVPPSYPYDPPKVTCETLVYHPNIDWQGHVCLNILRADWKPVLTLGSVLFGLMTLFLEPNPDDPLNKEAADLMINRRSEFESNVKKCLRGGYYFGLHFPKLI